MISFRLGSAPLEIAVEELKFRTIEGSGKIRLQESTVEVTLKQGFGHWKYEVPYNELRARPVYLWTTERTVYWCMAIGIVGLCFVFLDMFFNEDLDMPTNIRILISTVCTTLLAFAFLRGKLEWATYYGSKELSVYFARDRQNTQQFEGFIAELNKRIDSSTPDPKPQSSAVPASETSTLPSS